jgi:hypothetical protein
MLRLALESVELRRRIPQEHGEIAGRRLRGHLVEHVREAAVHEDGGSAPYCGEQSPTPTPSPSGIHPSVTICANSLPSVTSRWFGAPPMPLLYRR